MKFADRLNTAVRRMGNPVLVGIDPRPEDLPPGFLDRFPGDRPGVAEAIRVFGCGVVDVVAPLVPAVKFQLAFYEAYGPEGLAALHATAHHAKQNGLIIILDGKQQRHRLDGRGLRPRLSRQGPRRRPVRTVLAGRCLDDQSLPRRRWRRPLHQGRRAEDKGVFVLVRTSNVSAGEFQDLIADGRPLYRHVAERLAEWAAPYRGESGYSLVGAVVGATYPEQLAELRRALPGVLLLVPGYGTQGASGGDVAAAFDDDGLGAIINSCAG